MGHAWKVAATVVLATVAGLTAANGQSRPLAATGAAAESSGASGGVGVSVYLDEDIVVRIPADVAARLQALLRLPDGRHATAGVREFAARHARRSPLLAEAIRRYAESRRASDPVPVDAGAMEPARAAIAELPSRLTTPASRASTDAVHATAPNPAIPENLSSNTSPDAAPALSDSVRAATPRPVPDPIGRSAETSLLTPAIGTVGPVLRQVASPVLP